MDNLILKKHHKNYSIYSDEKGLINYYSNGPIESLKVEYGKFDNTLKKDRPSKIIITFKDGSVYCWETIYIDYYNVGQYGIAVSNDGTKVFAQTWENGMFCFDLKTGDKIWKTKSRRGITNVFVGDNTITVILHNYSMQVLDIDTGEVLIEKRPCTAHGFKTLNNKYIVCQVTARRWELIEAETLETKETFKHKEFTNNHTDYVVNHVSLCENGDICVKGFKNVFDDSFKPAKRLPNLYFEHNLHSEVLAKK